ncbi:hypothetical protein FA13DRAFT_1714199 [Coprinellus micaceus]|uniref:Uncharacterized protein n=1 Tax=Coprinellus micaceus TaxID=71717 RepID=A0A4Y7ST88_COPMI|nr:hypothetical protein FA13DRAFT_1714199 [Coprinellus micaceus]
MSISFASTQEFAHLTRQEVPAQHQGNSTYSSHPIWTFELAAMAVELLVMALRQSAARSIPREAKAVVGKKISMNRVDQSKVGPLSDGAGSEKRRKFEITEPSSGGTGRYGQEPDPTVIVAPSFSLLRNTGAVVPWEALLPAAS